MQVIRAMRPWHLALIANGFARLNTSRLDVFHPRVGIAEQRQLHGIPENVSLCFTNHGDKHPSAVFSKVVAIVNHKLIIYLFVRFGFCYLSLSLSISLFVCLLVPPYRTLDQ